MLRRSIGIDSSVVPFSHIDVCERCEILLEVAFTSHQIKVEYGLLQEVHGEEIGWLPLQAGFGLGSARLKDWDTQVREEPDTDMWHQNNHKNNHNQFKFWYRKDILLYKEGFRSWWREGEEIGLEKVFFFLK